MVVARATLTQKFQITIPSQVRRHLNLKSGDVVYLSLEDDRVILRTIPENWTENSRGLGAAMWREEGGRAAIERERDSWDQE